LCFWVAKDAPGFPDLVDVGVVGHNQRLKRWHFEPASDAPLELLASITTRPRRGIAMVIHRR
jgi:hypothetical protein